MISKLNKLKVFLLMNWPDKMILAVSTSLILITRIVFLVVPYSLIRSRFLNLFQSRGCRVVGAEIAGRRVIWAVESVSRHLRVTHCLTKAVVAKLLLNWYGYHADFLIGVKLSSHHKIEAHAWLESDGRVVMGYLPDLDKYSPFPEFVKNKAGKFI